MELPDGLRIRPVRPKEWVEYRCRRCGECCREVSGKIMVESLDAYRIANFLRAQGQPMTCLSDFYARYTEPSDIAEGYPIFLMKTAGPDNACVFLKDSRCSIYPARPRACRIYPFSVGPGQRGRDFEWVLCIDDPAHFSGGKVHVKEWIRKNFSREDREFVKREYDSCVEIGKLLRRMNDRCRNHALIPLLMLRYDNFDLNEPFLPQYDRNLQTLLEHLSALADESAKEEGENGSDH